MTADELRELLVNPSTGILSRMLGTMGNLSTRLTDIEGDVPQRVYGSDFVEYQNRVEGELIDMKNAIAGMAQTCDACMKSVAQLAAEVEKLAAKPKRSRPKKEVEPEMEQEVAAPAEEPAPAPEIPAPEPVTGTINDVPVIDGIRMTQFKVRSLQNDVRVLQGPALVLQLNPDLTENALNFALQLTDEQISQLPQE